MCVCVHILYEQVNFSGCSKDTKHFLYKKNIYILHRVILGNYVSISGGVSTPKDEPDDVSALRLPWRFKITAEKTTSLTYSKMHTEKNRGTETHMNHNNLDTKTSKKTAGFFSIRLHELESILTATAQGQCTEKLKWPHRSNPSAKQTSENSHSCLQSEFHFIQTETNQASD